MAKKWCMRCRTRHLSTSPHDVPRKSSVTAPNKTGTPGIYEAWALPGSEPIEEQISASELKSIGAYIIIAGAFRKFRIEHDPDNGRLYTWRLLENRPVGRDHGAVDNWERYDDFSTLREALAKARKLVSITHKRKVTP